MKKLNILIYSLSLILLISCKKENECAENLILIGPDSVVEGETIHLKIYNSISGANTYYYWTYANMDPYPQTVGGAVEVSSSDPVQITNTDVRDEGWYHFKVNPGKDKCKDITVSKHIKIIPKTSPCINTVDDNFLQIDESFSPNVVYQNFTPLLDPDFSSSNFRLTYAMPMFTYSMYIDFYKEVPNYSSTYILRNRFNTDQDGLYDDDFNQALISFAPATSGANEYRMLANNNNLYIKIENNQMIVTFCDVIFTSTIEPSKTIKVSGKSVIDL